MKWRKLLVIRKGKCVIRNKRSSEIIDAPTADAIPSTAGKKDVNVYVICLVLGYGA